MGQIFQSFIGGEQAGRENSEARRRRNALEQAGTAYGAGDTEGAENALMGAGLVNEAGAYSALAEARRNRTNRQSASEAARNLDPNATPSQRLNAMGNAYLEAGDGDQWARYSDMASGWNAQQAEYATVLHDTIANFRLGQIERGIPVEQRQADALMHAQEFAQRTGVPVEQVTQMAQGVTDWSDEAGRSVAQEHQTAAQRLAEQTRQAERRQDIDREESQFSRSLAARNSERSLGAPQIRQFGNDYERGLNSISEAIGPQITNAMPWALQVAGNGQVPQGTNTETALINDTGMLRAVARLQTGVGVLTEGEVRSTLGDNIANRLQQAGATINLDEALRPEVRQALATLVQSGVSRASQQAWQYRDNSIEEYRSVNNNQDPVGWGLPSLPHPQDMGSLRAAESLSQSNGQPPLRPNDVRIAPSGREYIYMGPGNWLPRSVGNTEGYTAARNQRLANGGAPTVSVGGAVPNANGGRTAPTAPAVGTVVDGFRFRGGDPNNQNNWVDVRTEQPGAYRGR